MYGMFPGGNLSIGRQLQSCGVEAAYSFRKFSHAFGAKSIKRSMTISPVSPNSSKTDMLAGKNWACKARGTVGMVKREESELNVCITCVKERVKRVWPASETRSQELGS
jgi:hypothetical protein